MKIFIIILAIVFSMSARASWYESTDIDWWIVVYSQMQCSKASDIGNEYNPVTLIEIAECVYEAEYSTEKQIASIGCEEKLNTGFIFATEKEYCDSYIIHMQEALNSLEQ